MNISSSLSALAPLAGASTPTSKSSKIHDAAQQFSAFYRDCHVLGAAEEGGDEDFRLVLSMQAKRVIAKSLDLLGVEAPESM